MTQGTFPITKAREELGFTPIPAVRANIDVRTGEGEVGAAVGRGAIQVTQNVIDIRREQQRMQDTRAQIDANAFVTEAVNENKAFRNINADTKTWGKDLDERLSGVEDRIGGLDLSDDARALVNTRFAAQSKTARSLSLIAETDRDKVDTRAAIINDVIEAYRSGTEQTQKEAAIRFLQISPNLMDSNEARVTLKTAIKAGRKSNVDDLVNTVHAAIERGTGTGDFTLATELAKNDTIPETKQTSLRTAIRTAENAQTAKAKSQETAAINLATSTAIREYLNGKQTVANLNSKHEAGLIKDSEFKTMFEGLTKTIPDNSNIFANGKIRRAMVDLEMDVIPREEADKIISEQYEFLDGPDRSKVLADLEDVSSKIIGTAKANAYSEGRGLMSAQFVGIQSQDDFARLILGTPGLSDEDKARINRRFTTEINNRDLYERAVDEKFRDMRKEGISDTSKFKAESLRVLLSYQRRKTLTLEELETEVSAEQRRILGPQPVKPVNEMSNTEKQQELLRIQELKKLTR